MDLSHNALVLLIALALDAAVGDPDALWRRLAHPVVLMGRAVGWCDARFNRLDLDESVRRRRGLWTLAAVAGGSALVGLLVAAPLRDLPFGFVAEGALASILIAQNSLHAHVAAVRRAFLESGLEGARAAVAMIVGRDPKRLDEAGVCRAAIESLAENFSDAVVAPVFWGLLFGFPGLFAYKAINTADSMIGHKSERHLAFGRAAAKLDDAVNFLPARLSGLIVVAAAALTGRGARAGLVAMRRDAARHASPNAGWPEAAFGGALGLALGGPRVYSGVRVDDPYMNEGGRTEARPEDISGALRLFRAACLMQGIVVALIAAVAWALAG